MKKRYNKYSNIETDAMSSEFVRHVMLQRHDLISTDLTTNQLEMTVNFINSQDSPNKYERIVHMIEANARGNND